MKSEELRDYHIGMVRGYLLAMKADPQILRAFSEVVNTCGSRTGERIGETKREAFVQKAPLKSYASEKESCIKEIARPIAVQMVDNVEEKKHKRYTDSDIESIKSMYEGGASVEDISTKLNRTPAAIYQRISIGGFKRARAS